VRRLFWLGLGVTVGVLVTRRVTSAARHLTPGGLAEDLAEAMQDLGSAIGSFGADVKAGMQQREQELQDLVEERTGSNGRARNAADPAR
jgi:hypothetical protein